MKYSEILEHDPKELTRRRRLADARRDRENEREALLVELIQSTLRAGQLRDLVGRYEDFQATVPSPVIQRMLEWARAQLGELEASVNPTQLSAILSSRNMFPEVDELADPLGEPPPRQPWGR